jgi:hypothetical protein
VIQNLFQRRTARRTLAYPICTVPLAAMSFVFFGTNVRADSSFFTPGNLVVSRSVYDDNPGNVQLGQLLPPNCTTPPGGCGNAIQDGTYPFVWNNDSVDGSFGITSKIFSRSDYCKWIAGKHTGGTEQFTKWSASDQGPDGHQFQLEVGNGLESFFGPPIPDFHGLLRTYRRDRCI